jgi:hypothetical protein
VVVRREALEAAGGFDSRFDRVYDEDLCLRVALLRPGNVHGIPLDMVSYRRHPGQISADWRAVRTDWQMMVDKLGELAPDATARAIPVSASHMHRYFGYLAYEAGEFGNACKLVAEAFRRAPGTAMFDGRNWKLGAACLAGFLLPGAVLRMLERMAGVHVHARK